MDLVLRRHSFSAHGIFGALFDEDNDILCQTLEHAYPDSNDCYRAKVSPGIYACIRGMHRLANSANPFETFMLENVPDFQDQPVTGILFHVGNWNKDSEGCILVGESISAAIQGSMLCDSREAFSLFMARQQNIQTFTLTVQPPT